MGRSEDDLTGFAGQSDRVMDTGFLSSIQGDVQIC